MKRQIQLSRAVLAAGLAALSLFLSSFAAAQVSIVELTLSPPPRLAMSQIELNVRFDRAVCGIGVAGSEADPLSITTSSIVQARRDGGVLSIVLLPVVQTVDVSCPTPASTTMVVALPPLPAGAFMVKLALAEYRFTDGGYFNYRIGAITSKHFEVDSDLPAPISVYLQNGQFGTRLTTVDGGLEQFKPTYAIDFNHWQPAFYVWPWTAEGPARLQRLYELALVNPAPLSERLFYTFNLAEKNALLATGAFVESADAPQIAVLAPTAGICPVGTTGIFRAFNPKPSLHRYVPAATYGVLLVNGWKGDGLAFCAAAEPEEPTSWAPN